MIEPTAKEYSDQLNQLGIRHSIVEHPILVSVEDVLKYFKMSYDQGASSMLMKADDNFVMVVRRDDCKLDFHKIRMLLNVKSLRIANENEFKEITKLPIGAARSYIPGIPTYIDKLIFQKNEVQSGSGSFTSSVRYQTQDLIKIPNSKIVDVVQSTKEYQGVKRVFSGTRATGRLHLGNYLGAVKGYIELQNNPEMECVYMVMDVHTITTPYNHHTLPQASKEVLLDYLAAGLDPEKAIITKQSLVPEHTELAFLFSSTVSVARMQHLPTFKDKVKQHPDNVTMALLNYPVLMAADILIYKASHIPTGVDQEPHIEIAREIARKMNDIYGTDFPEPVRFATPGEYVPSISGSGKMSKSVEGSYINLTDDLETIQKKLAGAPTDSGQGETVPSEGGVTNLLHLVELFQGKELRQQYETAYTSTGIRYGDLKQQLAEAISQELQPIQTKRRELESKPDYVNDIIMSGANKARSIASQTLSDVKTKMGLGSQLLQ
jgi:tryptophanyl-tRNA synthetase